MNILRKKFKAFVKKPFPRNVSSDESVSDLFMELADYDSYIAGLLDQATKNRKIDFGKLFYDQELEDQFLKSLKRTDLDEVSVIAIKEYLNYLEIIKYLIKEIKAQ